MGNKVSHDESSDREEGQNSGFRDMLKQKRQSLHRAISSSPKTGNKDESVAVHRNSNPQLGSGTESEHHSESDLHLTNISLPGFKPDGILKLAKELIILSHDEEGCDSIGLNTFSKYVCQGDNHLGEALFRDAIKCAKPSKKASSSNIAAISKEQFVAWSQKVTQLIGDDRQLAYYIQIFANDEDMLNTEEVGHFLKSCYKLSFTKDNEVNDETIQKVLSAMFHGKNVLGSKYVIHWIEENCPRVVTWMHRNLVHQLTVAFRRLQKKREEKAQGEPDKDRVANSDIPAMDSNLQQEFLSYLAGSPSSSKSPLFKSLAKQLSETSNEIEQLLSVTGFHQMQIWLLGSTLPLIFIHPQQQQKIPPSPSVSSTALMDPHTLITRLITAQNPTHWTLLYNSDNDGLSLNRFEHHVMGYRGPTVTFLHAEGNRIFCVAVDQAWKESIHFWGTSNTMVLQLSPEYRVLDRGEKLMYYNTSARGYPFGLHIGSDHRDPQVAVDKEFSVLSHRKIPYHLDSIQVWGCGSTELRESQLDHKKWEMKQVEKSRQVKLSAVDWNDHPDRHLLDLAGHRPNYSQFGNA